MTGGAQSNQPSSARWRGLLAGVLGGILGGAADVALTLRGQVPGLSGARSWWLLLLGIGLGGLAGSALAVVATGAARLARRFVSADRAAAVVAVLLASPLVLFDAFALFRGERASRVPGHHVLSVVLAGLVLAAVAWLAIRYHRRVRQAEAAPPYRKPVVLAVLVAVGAALAAYWLDLVVLPRLYPWFHLTLSLMFFVLWLLAAHLALAPGRARSWSALQAGALVVLSAAVLVPAHARMQASQSLRFAAHEKTLVASVFLRAVPLGAGRHVAARTDRQAAAEPPPPLPVGPRLPQADVVIITIDALRADHVGAYGYGRPTTPHIDALARRAVRFERAYAQAPHTSFSIASMLTGKYYPTIARLAPGDPHDPIAEVLRQYGWKTAAFYPPAVFYVDGHKLKAYQENNFRFEYVKVEFLDARRRLDQIAAFLDKEKPRRAFIWLHLFEPHEPYDDRAGHHFGKSDIDRYDSEVAYADEVVGRLLADLAAKRPGAIVILAADHGEAFDEHKSRYHGSTLYEEQVRVPLLIAVPGVKPHVVKNPVELIDVAPTILGLLDIPVPARMRGDDLGPWLSSAGAPEDRLPPVFAELEDKRMVVWRNEKLICDLNWGYCAYHDLGIDPHEEKNLADARPDRVAALRQLLDDWLDDHSRFEPQLLRGQANPEGGVVPKPIERGRLGDLGAVADLAAMLGSSAPLAVRREAARLLVMLPHRKETQALIEAALDTDDRELGDWVAVAATRFGGARARDRVRTLVAGPASEGPPSELRVQAALALTYVNDSTGVPVLSVALDSCENVGRCRLIILRLGAVKDRRAVPKLLEHLPEVMNRREMVAALGDIADPAATDALLERLVSDEYVPVRAEAAVALAKIGGPAALRGLNRAAAHEHETTVLAALHAAIAALEKTLSAPQPPAPTPGKARFPRSAKAR